ncbi:unnamed protein product, partial [Rotaria sp. Silwood1]
ITAINHPLPQIQVELDNDTVEDVITVELITVICIIFALAFIPASFLVFLIDEHSTMSKHLQFISGVKGITYWSANFLWDLINYCVSIGCFIIIFVAFNIESFGFALIPLM